MVRAIMNGRKTQTRRIVKESLYECDWWSVSSEADWNDGVASFCRELPLGARDYTTARCPYGKKGDRIWGREAHSFSTETSYWPHPEPDVIDKTWYRASNNRPTWAEGRWRPNIHMHRWASRILLEITSLRVEKIQDVSEDDALAEGIVTGKPYDDGDAVDCFQALWDSVYSGDWTCWDDNPDVWVIEFTKIDA